MTNAELAEAVGMAPATAHVRLRTLRQRGVITEFLASVDQRRLGLWELIGVTLRPGTRQANTTGFAEEVRGLPRGLQIFFVGGPDDFMVHIAVADEVAASFR